MSEQLQQSVMDAVKTGMGVVSATSATYVAAVANLFDQIQPIVGMVVLCVSFTISTALSRKRDKLLSREIELRDAQIEAINERKDERGSDEN